MYMPVLGSNKRFVINLPQVWLDGDHPYNSLFANGPQTRASHEVAGLQIADVIAHVVRQAVLRQRATDRVLAAYDALRPVLGGAHGRCLQIYRYENGHTPPRELYEPLYDSGSRISM